MKCTTNRCRTNVFDELERGFQQLVRGFPGSAEQAASDDPRTTVLESENRYLVECDLPGIAVENVSLQLEDNVLVISGQRPAIAPPEDGKVLFNERTSAGFRRTIPLSRPVDPTAVDAELINGVLRVSVPKRAEVLPRKIAIKSGSQVTSASGADSTSQASV